MKTLGLPLARWRTLLPVTILGLGCLALIKAREETSAERAFTRDLQKVSVVPPAGEPDINQASIDLAIVLYGIHIPATAAHPTFDPTLADRGLTTRGAFMDKAKVTIGPAAFSSWGLLGSTLAHELEVHCAQNFLAIYAMDLIGLDGTGAAEREAYTHELRNAKRFGLYRGDADMIADTMEYYYPDDPRANGPGFPRLLRTWLARNFLRSERPL